MKIRITMNRVGRHMVAACIVLALFAPGSARAAAAHSGVNDLRSGALRSRDLPGTLVVSKLRAFSHFSALMQISVPLRGLNPQWQPLSCGVPPQVAHYGFAQSMIEGAVGSKIYGELLLCGWRFTTDSGAHRALGVTLSWERLEAGVKTGAFHRIKTPAFGVDSMGIWSTASYFGPKHQPLDRSYTLFFRHANAFVTLSYLGPRTLTSKGFLQLAQTVNGRLR